MTIKSAEKIRILNQTILSIQPFSDIYNQSCKTVFKIIQTSKVEKKSSLSIFAKEMTL